LSSGFPTKILYAFLSFPIRPTCPPHHIFLDLIIIIILVMSINYEVHK
jgi:hypothetical protein